jgi:hypothetical protein
MRIARRLVEQLPLARRFSIWASAACSPSPKLRPLSIEEVAEILDRLGHPLVLDHRMDLARVTM